jgi:hypothetical protein
VRQLHDAYLAECEVTRKRKRWGFARSRRGSQVAISPHPAGAIGTGMRVARVFGASKPPCDARIHRNVELNSWLRPPCGIGKKTEKLL